MFFEIDDATRKVGEFSLFKSNHEFFRANVVKWKCLYNIMTIRGVDKVESARTSLMGDGFSVRVDGTVSFQFEKDISVEKFAEIAGMSFNRRDFYGVI